MIWISTIITLLILAFLLALLRASKGPAHSIESIERPIKDLLKRGYNGGFLTIDSPRSKKFLQLRKYINAPGDYGIELCFPNTEWSTQIFKKLKNFCIKSGIDYSIAKEDPSGPLEFLYIDFGKDDYKAHECLKKILLEIFELDKNTKLFVKLENATIKDKLIDR